MRRLDGDVVDEEPLVVYSEDDQPDDLAVALGDGHLVRTNGLGVVVGHRSRRTAEALDVALVGVPNELGQPRHIGFRRGPERDVGHHATYPDTALTVPASSPSGTPPRSGAGRQSRPASPPAAPPPVLA